MCVLCEKKVVYDAVPSMNLSHPAPFPLKAVSVSCDEQLLLYTFKHIVMTY